eukprot:6189066-Pleurochrysis_carterae.AAC.4
MGGASVPSESGRILLSRGSRCVGASTMSGPEGWSTIDTPLPLALGGAWWCSTPVLGSETCRRLTRRSGDFTRFDQCI